MPLEFQDWGLIDYEEALQKQLKLVEEVHATNSAGVLVFCSHPAVVTLGRASKPQDVGAWQGPTIEVSRGGRATYHGPSQLVVYPIINLTLARNNRSAREIAGYLRALENGIVSSLSHFGIKATGRSLQQKPATGNGTSLEASLPADETGVWIGTRKIASLGIAVKKWVTYHGAAINLTFDPQAFQGMSPCGFQPSTMVSLEELLQKQIPAVEFKTVLREELEKTL